MDTSPSILSAQYNNTAISPGELGKIRGAGLYSTDYPLSSNWPQANFQPSTSTYVKNTNKVIPVTTENWNLSSQMPVGKRVNDKFIYPKSLEHTLRGDPYTQFGLQANHSTPTALNTLFFNKINVKYLQNRILDEVEKITKIRIKPQSENSILVIMNNKYQYSLYGSLPSSPPHLALPRGDKPCSLYKRLFKLNQAVIQECVKEILSGMNMYIDYYKHASSLPVPLSLPTYVNSKGANVLFMSSLG